MTRLIEEKRGLCAEVSSSLKREEVYAQRYLSSL